MAKKKKRPRRPPRNATRLREAAPTSSGAIARRKPRGSARRSAAARGARRRSVARSPRRGSRSPPSRRSRSSAPSRGRTTSRRPRSWPRARPAARVPEHRPDLTPSQRHLAPGETITYPDPPATSGKHNGSQPPDDPKVFDAPFDETWPSTPWNTGRCSCTTSRRRTAGSPSRGRPARGHRLAEQRDVPRSVPDPHAGDRPHPDGLELPTVLPGLGAAGPPSRRRPPPRS